MKAERVYIVVLTAMGCTPPPSIVTTPEPVTAEEQPLARFMRESVNVPYSFAVLESDGKRRPVRLQHAAVVLQDAARDLVHWDNPPTDSSSARDVFFTYARHLARQADYFELAASQHDLEQTMSHLEDIRQTCNDCHRFFRPASIISGDVGYDQLPDSLGGAL